LGGRYYRVPVWLQVFMAISGSVILTASVVICIRKGVQGTDPAVAASAALAGLVFGLLFAFSARTMARAFVVVVGDQIIIREGMIKIDRLALAQCREVFCLNSVMGVRTSDGRFVRFPYGMAFDRRFRRDIETAILAWNRLNRLDNEELGNNTKDRDRH
jgi:branched-subunit amino acid transport protein